MPIFLVLKPKKRNDRKATNWMIGLTFTEIYESIIGVIENRSDLIRLACKGTSGGYVGAAASDIPTVGVTLNVGLSF